MLYTHQVKPLEQTRATLAEKVLEFSKFGNVSNPKGATEILMPSIENLLERVWLRFGHSDRSRSLYISEVRYSQDPPEGKRGPLKHFYRLLALDQSPFQLRNSEEVKSTFFEQLAKHFDEFVLPHKRTLAQNSIRSIGESERVFESLRNDLGEYISEALKDTIECLGIDCKSVSIAAMSVPIGGQPK